DEIRVLQLFPGSGEDPISCHLIKKPIVKCGTPEALSYTWGQELATEIIRIDGKELLVTPNLHAALRRLRQDLPLPLPLAMLPRTLWIDAICINQEDPHERAEQVGLMRRIYKRASRLVI
ncbi:hypothetical protein BDZ45DRAFT_559062, partial [Acephala macrosclerotiorum]